MDADRGFRRIEHTADEGFEAWGPTFGDACAEAALALFAIMGTPTTLALGPTAEIAASGADREDLVVRLLSALLVAFEVEGRFVTGARCVAFGADGGGSSVRLRIEGGTVDRRRERGLVEVKAATYHGLRVTDAPGRTTVRAFVDL